MIPRKPEEGSGLSSVVEKLDSEQTRRCQLRRLPSLKSLSQTYGVRSRTSFEVAARDARSRTKVNGPEDPGFKTAC